MRAHYIYTLPTGQYKRLFEFSVGLLESYYIADDRPVRCIDRARPRGQDTGGFALAVWAERSVPADFASPARLALATFLFTGE
jgi:hypothetical protein